jgi:methionyl-tRNA synthetase
MVSYEDFKKLELRIAEVLAAEPHPNADRLYVLTIRVGEAEKKIVAGIRLHYRPEELIGKKIVVVNNLEPAVIRGVESNGMLLAASEGESLTLLVPEKPISTQAVVR